jgi:hypothetical protein
MQIWSDDDLDDGDDIESWMAKRAADVARLNDPQADAMGREAWAAATQNGQDLSASTPSDVRALGAAQLACAQPPTALDSALQRARAAARGATDAVLLGHGDEAEAGIRSIPALLSGEPITFRFHEMMQTARDEDSYDQIHYPVSRAVGEVAGTGLAILGTDGAASAMVPRLAMSAARAMPAMTNMERGSVALVGAGAGVLGQTVSDDLSGHSPDWRDYASAALGGATTAATSGRLSPTYAGAMGAGVASSADGLLRGDVDPFGVAHAMTGGGYLSGFGRVIGENRSNALSSNDKGKLGEWLSDIKSVAQGNKVVGRQVPMTLADGRTTILDSVLENGPQDLVESKFGPYAKVLPNQRAGMAQFPERYRTDFWMPSHVGQMTGVGLSTLGLPAIDWADPNRRAWPQ